MAIYLLSGIGGNVFSALINDNLSVGASTAITGLMAAYVAYIVLNWTALEPIRHIRNYFLCIIIFLILMNLLLSVGNSSINNSGHAGGFITGFISSMALIQAIQPT